MVNKPTDSEKRANRPRTLADIVPGMSKDIFGKKNMLFGKMLAEWPNIAGADIAAQTVPMDLRYQRAKEGTKGAAQAILHLAVRSAYALELSYQKTLLIERLNMFFGYAAIKDIKIIQNSEIMNNKKATKVQTRPLPLQEAQKIDAQVAAIKENDLQIALKNLGKAIASRQSAAQKETE